MYITNKKFFHFKQKPALIKSKTGAVVRGLTYHQHGLGFIPAWCHMLLEFVVGSWLNCSEGYPLDTLVFLQLKNQHFFEFQFDQDRGTM